MTNGSHTARAVYFSQPSDDFIVRVAHDVKEACGLVETGFEHVAGNCIDGGKVFRKRKP